MKTQILIHSFFMTLASTLLFPALVSIKAQTMDTPHKRANHVLESVLIPTDPRGRIWVSQDRLSTWVVDVRQSEIGIRLHSPRIRANFRSPLKTVDLHFTLVRRNRSTNYHLRGNFTGAQGATLDFVGTNQGPRYFRAFVRCLDSCGSLIVDLFFRSEVRILDAQYVSNLHPDFVVADPEMDSSSTEPLPNEQDSAEGEMAGSDEGGGDPSIYVQPPLQWSFFDAMTPLVRDQGLDPIISRRGRR